MENVQERKMTIARGMTRLKTISAQLDKISNVIQNFGAWTDKHKTQLGDNNVSVEKNLNQTQYKIAQLYQQHVDLVDEFINIKMAIDRTNMRTYIEIAGKRMTIQEALLYKRNGNPRYGASDSMKYPRNFHADLINSYNTSVKNAENMAENYNRNLMNATEDQKKLLCANPIYFLDYNKLDAIATFQNEFLAEIDGTLNEANALTELIFED